MIESRVKKPVVRYHVCARRHEDEPIVKNGLAITPSDMASMMQQGIPISAQAHAIVEAETPAQASDFFVPAEHVKHSDMVDLWNAKLDAMEKVRGVRRKVKSGEIKPMESQATE